MASAAADPFSPLILSSPPLSQSAAQPLFATPMVNIISYLFHQFPNHVLISLHGFIQGAF
jgi:hypothetical protein